MPHSLTADQFISQLYRGASQIPQAEFATWALEQLRKVIDFDGALWGTGHVSNPVFQTQTTLDVSEQLFSDLTDTLDINPIFKALINADGQPVDMADVIADEQFYRSDIYRQCFQPHGIERILSSMELDARSGIFTLLTLYRFDREHRFNAEEKQLQQQCLYHLLSAASHRRFLTLKGLDALPENDSQQANALCDNQGVFHAVEPKFLDIIEQHINTSTLQHLPFKLDSNKGEYLLSGLNFQVTPIGDLLRVTVRPSIEIDKLTEREREVVEGICQGKTFKQVARDLALSPSTISNHLYRIYIKLGVNTRSELIALVKRD